MYAEIHVPIYIFLTAVLHQRTTREISMQFNDEAFVKMCAWLEDHEQQDKQFTLVNLLTRLISYLPPDVPPYSNSHIKRRLQEHFGSSMTVAEIDGKTNVVTFKKRVANILHENYEDTTEDDETRNEEANVSMSRSVGSIINNAFKT